MANICMVVAYMGTHFLGWQKTKMGPSIEEALQDALEQFFQTPIKLQAASRTDAGVHAHGQVVNFFCNKENSDFNILLKSINGMLPRDVVIKEIEQAEDSFHPTLDLEGKEYHYWVCSGTVQMPFNRHFSWHFPHKLDIALMVEAAQLLQGTHDFSALCNVKKDEDYESHERTVQSISIEAIEDRVKVTVRGNRFLYKMVRNIVGLLVYVGAGRVRLEDVHSILEERDRKHHGVTAPAHGLTLDKIF